MLHILFGIVLGASLPRCNKTCLPDVFAGMSLILTTEHLDFSYSASRQILHSLHLQVHRGSIYCFLGPNGAGKTTTLRILLGLIRVGMHKVSVFGEDLHVSRISILRRVGSLIEQPSLYCHLTGKENLEIFRLTYGVPKNRIAEVLGIVGLSNARDQVVKTYSLGMKQRLAIAIALLHDPELLVLDEPTNGLDPQGIVEMRELMTSLNKVFGKTILISSHLLSEVEKVATHFGIIHKGQLLFQGTAAALQQFKSGEGKFEVEVGDADHALSVLNNRYTFQKLDASVLQFPALHKEQVPDLLTLLVKEEIKIYKAAFGQDNLEDVFMKITGS